MSSLVDVAHAAGVSRSTVSNALRHPERLNPETRSRVLRTAAALGYVPNTAARALRGQRALLFGVGVPNLDTSFRRHAVRTLDSLAWGHGVHVLIRLGVDSAAGRRDADAAFRSVCATGSVYLVPPAKGRSGLVELDSALGVMMIVEPSSTEITRRGAALGQLLGELAARALFGGIEVEA